MADLTELQAAGMTKLIGSDATGLETNPVDATSARNLLTHDVANVSGVYGSIALSTTPALLKVGGSALANRKNASFDNTLTQTVYWGYDASVSSTNFAGRIFKDQQAAWAHGPNVTIYLVLASGSGTGHISEAS